MMMMMRITIITVIIHHKINNIIFVKMLKIIRNSDTITPNTVLTNGEKGWRICSQTVIIQTKVTTKKNSHVYKLC